MPTGRNAPHDAGPRHVDRSGALLIVGALVASLVLVGAYLTAGGASYTPAEAQDPCEPREWRDPGSLSEIAQQFSLSALDGAACELGVTREALARALASPEARERFGERYGIDDMELAEAIRAGLVRAVDDAEEAGALPPIVAGPVRGFVKEIPLDQAIELVKNAESLLGDPTSILGGASELLDPAEEILEGLLEP